MSQRLIALILGTVLLSACAGLPHGASINFAPAGALQSVPFPKDRVVSAVTEYTHTGVETDSRSPGASELPPRLELTSAAGGIEWATYVFVPSGSYPLNQGTVTLGGPGSFGVWVAVANFAKSRWDFSGPYTGVATLNLSADDLSPLGNVYMAVVVNDGGVAKIDEVKISETTPDPPVASLTSPTPKVNPLQSVDLDASGSTTSNGTIDHYEWDLDGDGIFNTTPEEMAANDQANATVTFGSQPTAIDVSVRVTDSLALQDTATLTVTAIGWVVVNLDSASGVGDIVSLAEINGKPAVAYNSSAPPSLAYAYSGMEDGTSGWSTLTVDPSGLIGDCSLAQINGFPAIAYELSVPHDLYYAYSSTPDGSAGWNMLALNTAGEVQPYCGLIEVGGKPAVGSYVATGGTGGEVDYYYSSTNDGSSGWTSSIVDTGDTCGSGLTMANIAGTPALMYCYYNLGVYYMRYAKNDTADGTGTWTFGQVTTDVGLPDYLNLLVLPSGNPVATFRSLNNTLFYARCTAPVGGTWSKVGILGADTGNGNSLALIQGRPAISTKYADLSLNFGRPTTDDGSGAWNFNPVMTETVQGSTTSLAEIDGRPAVAYRHTPGGLFYATLFD